MITSLLVTECRLKFDYRSCREILTAFLANCQVTAIPFSDEAQSPILLARKNVILDFITSIQPTDRRSPKEKKLVALLRSPKDLT